jgi:hypothetical protein
VEQFKYYYLQSFTYNCQKTEYKGYFQPSELLCPVTYNWCEFYNSDALIKKFKFTNFYQNEYIKEEKVEKEKIETKKIYKPNIFIGIECSNCSATLFRGSYCKCNICDKVYCPRCTKNNENFIKNVHPYLDHFLDFEFHDEYVFDKNDIYKIYVLMNSNVTTFNNLLGLYPNEKQLEFIQGYIKCLGID